MRNSMSHRKWLVKQLRQGKSFGAKPATLSVDTFFVGSGLRSISRLIPAAVGFDAYSPHRFKTSLK